LETLVSFYYNTHIHLVEAYTFACQLQRFSYTHTRPDCCPVYGSGLEILLYATGINAQPTFGEI